MVRGGEAGGVVLALPRPGGEGSPPVTAGRRDPLAAVDSKVFTGRDRPVETYGRGRRCETEGCSTVLRSTRPGEHCSVHEVPQTVGEGEFSLRAEAQTQRRLREAREANPVKSKPATLSRRSHTCGPADCRRLEATRRHRENHRKLDTPPCEWSIMCARYAEYRRRNPRKSASLWLGWEKYGIPMKKGQT